MVKIETVKKVYLNHAQYMFWSAGGEAGVTFPLYCELVFAQIKFLWQSKTVRGSQQLRLSVITLPLHAPRCACFLLTPLLSVIPVLVDAVVA